MYESPISIILVFTVTDSTGSVPKPRRYLVLYSVFPAWVRLPKDRLMPPWVAADVRDGFSPSEACRAEATYTCAVRRLNWESTIHRARSSAGRQRGGSGCVNMSRFWILQFSGSEWHHVVKIGSQPSDGARFSSGRRCMGSSSLTVGYFLKFSSTRFEHDRYVCVKAFHLRCTELAVI